MMSVVIIPAYRPDETLAQLAGRLWLYGCRIVVVDDGSGEAYRSIFSEIGELCTVLRHSKNRGKGAAIKTALSYIRENLPDCDVIGIMDADGQHDVCNIPVIYQRLKQQDADGRCPDIVLCSRFMEGSAEYSVSATKKLAYGFFRWMIKISTGRKIADPTTGLQGLNRRAFLYYSKYKHFDDKYPDANMIIQMQLLGFCIDEIPAVMHARSCGTSMHSGLKPVVYMFRMVFSIIGVVFRIKVLGIDAGAGERDVFMDKKE